jgi:hypothetical protein
LPSKYQLEPLLVARGGAGSIHRSDLNGANIVTIIPSAYVYDSRSPRTTFITPTIISPAPSSARTSTAPASPLVTEPPYGIGLINGPASPATPLLVGIHPRRGGGIRRASLTGTSRTKPLHRPRRHGGPRHRGAGCGWRCARRPGARVHNAAAGPGGFAFTLLVQPGNTYRLYTSGNLTNWTEITNFVSAGTTATFTNAISPGATNFFFRARTP